MRGVIDYIAENLIGDDELAERIRRRRADVIQAGFAAWALSLSTQGSHSPWVNWASECFST